MLASPILRTRTRDNWIGWSVEAFTASVANGTLDPAEALTLLRDRVEKSLTEIRWDDLITHGDMADPTERTILKLIQRGAGAQAARTRELEDHFAERRENESLPSSLRSHKKDDLSDRNWLSDSEDHLFVRKRAETLVDLLTAKQVFSEIDWPASGIESWNEIQRHPRGARAIAAALTEVRKAGLASEIADLSVCGAIPPYNTLLGGKLVALLMASTEVRRAWTDRYTGQVSIIASQMAGRPICRSADLRMLTTTSLYGMSSSQYNRLKLYDRDHPKLGRDIIWQQLEHTTGGYGTVHLGSETVRALRALAEDKHRAKRINHVFGEGTSPRLRQVREGLEVLGIKSDDVLHHATPRLFYACELHDGARSSLIGFETTSGGKTASANAICEAWRVRWLSNRSQNPEILTQVAQFAPEQLAMSLVGMPPTNQLDLALA